MPDKSNDADILRHTKPPGLKLWGVLALCAAAVIVVVGVGLRIYSSFRTEAWTDNQAVLSVQTIQLKGAKGGDLTLPGDVQAFTNAPIYAQVSGYVKKWYVDIGTPVKAGQLLAELNTPDLDGQLAAGQANLASAVANQSLSAATAKRWDQLLIEGAVARQDADAKDADLAAKNAAVAAARATVSSLQAQESFKRLTAPFDGIVTSRSVDVGALVTVGTAAATPLFTVTDQTKLRIYVHVPQIYSDILKPGMTASFTVPEHPGRKFTATLAASAGAVAASSGTQLVQFQIDNTDGAIKPGDYAEMHFTLSQTAGTMRVPATALLFRDGGMMVATVNASDHVVLKPIHIATDLGAAVIVNTGLSPQDRVIDNPPDSIHDGDAVHASPEAVAAPTAN